MELGEMGLVSGGIEIYDNGSEKFLNFLNFYFLKLKIFIFFENFIFSTEIYVM